MRIRPIRLLASYLLALALLPVLLAGPARADGGPKLTLQWGLGGHPRGAGWMPVVIDLTGGAQAVDGTLVVDPAALRGQMIDSPAADRNQNDLAQPYIQRPVHLAAGAKQRVVVWVPTGMNWQPKVQLKAGSNVLAAERLEFTFDGSVANGLILAPEGDLTNLGGVRLAGGGTVRWGRMAAADLPETAVQLGSVDVLVLGRVDTRAWTPAQKEALQAWVASGGRLVVTGGPEAATAAAGLPPELLPVTLGGQTTADAAPLLALDATNVGSPTAATNAPLVRLTPKDGARIVAGSAAAPLAVHKSIGLGAVLYLAADPSLAPLSGDSRMTGALTALLPGTSAPSNERMNGTYEQLTTQMSGLRMPRGGLVLLLLLGYLVVLGPLQYLVLKRLDRRELMWLTTPVLAIVLVGAAWVGARGVRGLMTATHTAVEVAPGQGVATETDIAGIFSPSSRSLTITVPKGALVVAPNSYGGGDIATPVWTGDQVRFEQLSTYRPSGLLVTHQVKLAGGLALTNLTLADGRITATVENNTGVALRQVHFVGRGIAGVLVGDLAVGARQSLTITAATVVPNLNPNQGMPMNVQININTQPQAWNGPQDGPQPWVRDQLIQTAIQESLTARSANFWLVGYTDQPAQPWVLDLPRDPGGAHVILSAVSLTPAGPVGALPIGMVVGGVTDPSTAMNGGGQMLDAGEHAAQFHLPVLAPTAAEIQVGFVGMGPNGNISKVTVRNWRTNAWDVGVVASVVDHVGPGGLVQTRFTTDATFNLTQATISVREGK